LHVSVWLEIFTSLSWGCLLFVYKYWQVYLGAENKTHALVAYFPINNEFSIFRDAC